MIHGVFSSYLSFFDPIGSMYDIYIYLHLIAVFFMGFHVGKYASLSHGSVMGRNGFLGCMSSRGWILNSWMHGMVWARSGIGERKGNARIQSAGENG